MFIKPTYAIEQGWVTGIKDEKLQVQPNAIDFTLDRLSLLSTDPSVVTEDRTHMRGAYDAAVGTTGNGDPIFVLQWNRVYDGMSDMYLNLPEGVAAILYTRSRLARNGVFLMSGLYDSGYKGHVGFTLYPIGGMVSIGVGTRVGQIAFVRAESAGLYAGSWNHSQGTHYTDANKEE